MRYADIHKTSHDLSRRFYCLLIAMACSAVLMFVCECHSQETVLYEQDPINYSAARPHDRVDLLQMQIAAGELKLGSTDRQAIEALLRRLKIPIESQLLVFSRTSFQRDRIRPSHPRALYFNDNYYVGWVPGGLIELATLDPVLGPIFYSLNPAAVQTNAAHCFVRDYDCMRCHGGTFVRGIPGLLARSIFPDDQGDPITRFGSEIVDLRTAFTNRWGGWYVTGLHGDSFHRGNQLFSGQAENPDPDFKRGANITNLTDQFDVKNYLLKGASDIIALLVFEQQITIQNTLTRASLDTRRMLDYQKNLQIAFKTPTTEEPAFDSVKSVFEHDAQEVVDDLLFKDEARLPANLQGSPAFQKAFLSTALKTSDGKSLKDFDLRGHLFQNRCSYLIYSESFRNLPAPLKHRIYARLGHALRPVDPDPRYAYLDADERQRILSILRETDPSLGPALSAACSEIPTRETARSQ